MAEMQGRIQKKTDWVLTINNYYWYIQIYIYIYGNFRVLKLNICEFLILGLSHCMGTQRCCNVELTSLTLIQHHNNVVCPVGFVNFFLFRSNLGIKDIVTEL